MSTTAGAFTHHPVTSFAGRVNTVLDGLLTTPCWSMTVGEQRQTLIDLTRAAARVEELRLRLLAAGDRDDIAADCAASSTAAWLAHATRLTRGEALRDVRFALALDADLHHTRTALAAGAVNGEQARVIAAAITALPEHATSADPTLAERAEKHLVGLAAEHDARSLKHLARHVLHVLDPAAADEALGGRLEAEEKAAAAATSFEIYDNGDGTHRGRFRISSLRAAMLKKAFDALLSPSRRATTADARDGDSLQTRSARPPRPEQLGHAFGELIERLEPARVPTHGGVNATVVVTIDIETLLRGLGTAHLDTGDDISAALARRLACEAGVIPAVVRRLVDGRSVVLDMGRKRRLHTEAQRIALAIQQGGCTADGCSRPSAWCHAHHDIPWSAGGDTSVANGRLLCAFHHAKAHSTSHASHPMPNGGISFHRRT